MLHRIRCAGIIALTACALMAASCSPSADKAAEPRAEFARVRAASERVRALAPDATAISAGMSGDFREAILEGATHLRIGTAITGKREAPA